MKSSDTPKVNLPDVLKAFWKAVKPQQGAMYFTLVAFFIAFTLRLIVPLFYKRFFDTLVSGGDKNLLSEPLVGILVSILAIHMVAEVFFFFAMYVLNGLESKTMARLKQMSFDYMIKHSHSFFANNFTGALVQRVNRFSRSFERLYDTFVFNIMPLAINVAGVIIIVWFHEPVISYIILAWIIVIMVLNLIFSKWKLQYDLKSAQADSTTTALLADNVTNQSAITLFTNYSLESSVFKETSDEQAKIQKFTWNLSNIADAVQIVLMAIVEFCIFYYALKFWQRDLLSIGTFVLFQVYILGISYRLWDFGKIIRNLYESFADSKEMVAILKTSHEIKDMPDAKILEVKEGRIDFKDATFSFNENQGLIKNFNLFINGGEKVALIGPSGAGKSTIVRLLLRTYDVTSGAILIDRQEIENVTQNSLHRNISFVPQEPVLFHRTLIENIRYGRPGASDTEVMEAARLAHCDEFIENLPLKYKTFVGERGIKLSGGERQRVAIARAILKNAPILILDEATSSLDSHSEALIQDALDKLMRGKTSIVIAHRLSTIRKMDRIVVIENGKVVEDGSHDKLLENESSLYKKLWNLQAGGFISE
ncbi:MAG: ABC transporter ATP-binding protein [bacterium]|nr:ABC transporter ATP-binding protein [bacterium]